MKDSYRCPKCGYVLPKKEAKISGWETHKAVYATYIALDAAK